MNDLAAQDTTTVYHQSDRDYLLALHRTGAASSYIKTARIIAYQLSTPFIVNTDRGPMQGQPGDWLVTNHPDDDSGSDIWSISDDRMKATYEVAE